VKQQKKNQQEGVTATREGKEKNTERSKGRKNS
jgi:hypothetical protein